MRALLLRYKDTRDYDTAHPGPWKRWFAWYPVLLFSGGVNCFWLETVERRRECDGISYYWAYKFKDGTIAKQYPLYD